MKKKILILAGGFSKEREISLITARSVNNELKKKKYLTKICEPDGNLISNIKYWFENLSCIIKTLELVVHYAESALVSFLP